MNTPRQTVSGVKTESIRSVRVYEAPVRLWHWVNALSIIVLALTGFYIGQPLLPAMAGEASDNFLMGYIRFIHFAAAYIFTIGLLGRIYWALVGNEHARHLILPNFFSAAFWEGAWHQLRYYLLLEKEQRPSVGSNPLDQVAMVFFFTLPALFLIFTGFALYGEGLGQGSWADRWFGWVIPLLGGSQGVHTWHRLVMWALLCYALLHVYLVIRQDIVAKQSYVSTMISGYRMFRD